MLLLMRSRERLAVLVWGIILLGAVASGCGYYAVSVALGPEPPARVVKGWIAILQPATDLDAGLQVRVNAFALSHADSPRMAYGLNVCGSHPFSGYMLIGGDARLNGVALNASRNVAKWLPGGGVKVADQGDGSLASYEGVQVIRVSIKDPPPCLGAPSDEAYVGTGFRVEGYASGPVVASSSGLGLNAAVERWSMPYVGGLPGLEHRIGIFAISGAIDGDFVRPVSFSATVDAGAVPLGMEASDARPPADSVDRASWHGSQPFQATTKVRNSAYETNLQRWSAICAISLGVFGSIMASMLFELIRSSTSSSGGRSIPLVALKGQSENGRGQLATKGCMWLLTAIAGLVLCRLRRGRRK